MANEAIVYQMHVLKTRASSVRTAVVQADWEEIKHVIESYLVEAVTRSGRVIYDILKGTATMKVYEYSGCSKSGMDMYDLINCSFTFDGVESNMADWFRKTYKIEKFDISNGAIYVVW